MALLPGDEKIKRFYKFRPANCHTLYNLVKQQLRFSYPREFNDPFDCALRITFDGAVQDWQKWLDEMGLSSADRNNLEQYLASIDYNGKAFDQSKYPEDINSLLVLALSEINDHILLWSHYAENHKGICLGFATRIEGNSLGILFDEPTLTFSVHGVTKGFLPVRKAKYTRTMPEPYNRLKDDNRKLMEFSIAKHVDWEYESERRIVLPKSVVGTQFLRYDKSTLEEVIFGYRTSDDFKKDVRDIIEKYYSGTPVQLYQAKPKEGEYSLIIEKI